MSKYSDEEIDKVALAILNDDRRRWGDEPLAELTGIFAADSYRDRARVALAAREKLFKVVRDRWEVRIDNKVYDHSGDAKAMREWAQYIREQNNLTDEVKVFHVITRRKKKIEKKKIGKKKYKYTFRNLPWYDERTKTNMPWIVQGRCGEVFGVLEWCYNEGDAKHLMSQMEKDDSFSNLSISEYYHG